MRAFKNSIRQEVAKHFAEFFLEVESTERRQPATSSCRLALHRLERGGAASASRRGKTPSGDGRTVSTAEEPHAPDADAQASDSELEAHVMEPLADDHSSDSEDAPIGAEESAAPAAPAVAAAQERAALSLLERLQAIRIIYGSKPPS